MKKTHVIYEDGDHRWLAVARDPDKQGFLIDTNEYLVLNGEHALLTDPGGMEIFSAVFSAISTEVDPRSIQWLFASHQDPDIISSLSLWLDFNPKLRCYLSWMWGSFIPHFGGDDKTFINLPDEGGEIAMGDLTLQAVPAHYLHSCGNFHLYDPKAKLMFSGDVGAALLPPEMDGIFVQDFDRHVHHAEAFHKRWMGSNEAKLDWCERASKLDIDMLCPQHGAIYQGKDVARFIDWLSQLNVGTGLQGRTCAAQ